VETVKLAQPSLAAEGIAALPAPLALGWLAAPVEAEGTGLEPEEDKYLLTERLDRVLSLLDRSTIGSGSNPAGDRGEGMGFDFVLRDESNTQYDLAVI
jgi:hypothetical protein